jgi:hypothetical protein
MSRSGRRWAGTVAVGILATASVMAGNRFAPVVFIDDGVRFASGSLGGAHNTADRVQLIGCTVGPFITNCVARNSAGLTRSCFTSDTVLIANARAINGSSILSFSWNANGQCTGITVENTSRVPPKVLP